MESTGLHTITEQPCKNTGAANIVFLPGSFLFLIPFTATVTSMLFSTSGYQESLTDRLIFYQIKQQQLKKKKGNRVITSLPTR